VFGRAALFRKGDAEEGSLDRERVRQALAARGMTERVEQQIHVACLQRAIAQAQRQ
jgi:predicted DsbA family dithiol-disulfide isomerase